MSEIEKRIAEGMDILRSYAGKEPGKLYIGYMEFSELANALMGKSQSFGCQIRPFEYMGMRIVRVMEDSWLDIA